MTTLSDAVMTYVEGVLETVLTTNPGASDPAQADEVKIGPLQGDPELDDVPVSVEIYSGDPEKVLEDTWEDEIIAWEIGGVAYWARRYTIRYRALLVDSGESLAEALAIISTLQARIEKELRTTDWGTITADDEAVEFINRISSKTIQSGGPDEYDWLGKTRFELVTRAYGA